MGHHGRNHVDRHREGDAGIGACAADDGGVDAHQTAFQIHQRAARIAHVDGGIRLDEILVVVIVQAGAAQSADDALRHGLTQAERVAHRHHIVTDAQVVDVGKRQFLQLVALDFQQGDIRAGITAQQLRGVLATVLQRYHDLVSIGDHMVIGDDIALLGIHDDARASAPHRP